MPRSELILCCTLFVLSGCGPEDVPSDAVNRSLPQGSDDPRGAAQNPREVGSQPPAPLPPDVALFVLAEELVPPHKRSLDIRLSRRVTEAELEAIAYHLKRRERRPYDRTFIAYYLPGMVVGAGAWAISHFEPELVLQIQGSTVEQHSSLAAAPTMEPSRETIGVWLDERPFVTARITIYREGGKTYVESRYLDGGSRRQLVVESRSARGMKFTESEPDPYGDHYLLNAEGNLELRDNDGLITSARRVGG